MAEKVIFSVIVPAYNRIDSLKLCIKSLLAQSTSKNEYEIIVVDDGSTDGTYEKLSETYGVKVFRLEQRSGPAFARNYGAGKAEGLYLAFTDSDCVVPSDWLAKIGEGYEKNDVAGVGGAIVNTTNSTFSNLENFIYSKYKKANEPYLSTQVDELPFALGNISYKKSVFEEVGGFNIKIPFVSAGEDAELKRRILKKGYKLAFMPIIVNHNHKLDLKGFYNQSLIRGAGMLLDSKLRGKMQTRVAICLRLTVVKIYFIKCLIDLKNFDLAFKETIFYVFRNLGKLKYYDQISKLDL